MNKTDISADNSEAKKILDAARRYIFTHGFRSLTMDKLAAEAGTTKKFIYTHFHGKQLLLEATIKAKIADMDHDMTQAEEKAGDFAEFGGLLGRAPIIAVNKNDCSKFINRGGRIPAPIQALKN